jgi:hypothetical protein
MKNYLNLATGANHYGWPFNNNHFFLLGPLQGIFKLHVLPCANIIKGVIKAMDNAYKLYPLYFLNHKGNRIISIVKNYFLK